MRYRASHRLDEDFKMTDSDIRFGCIGCGACCTGRYIPLTLDEAKQWLERGDGVGILLEAFNQETWGSSTGAFEHSLARSSLVSSGESTMQVIAIFAGKAIPRCPNLLENGMCNIYDIRPLVCRIYPMEINPFIELVPESKDCPPVAWEAGEILVSDRVMEPIMSRNIASSKAADRSDALTKIAVCEELGLTTAAWKSDGLAIYNAPVDALLAAINTVKSKGSVGLASRWSVRTDRPQLSSALANQGLAVCSDSSDFDFHQF